MELWLWLEQCVRFCGNEYVEDGFAYRDGSNGFGDEKVERNGRERALFLKMILCS